MEHKIKRRKVGTIKRKRISGPRSGTTSVIGSRKRRRHAIKGKSKKRRRMGSPGEDAVGEYFGTLLGVGVGLVSGELTTPIMQSNMPLALVPAVKGLASIGIFYIAKKSMKNNSFVKGVGIGLGGSAINDGLRYAHSQGMISGPKDAVMEIKVINPNKRKLMPPMNGAHDNMNVIGLPGMADDSDFYEAEVLNG